MKQFPDLNKWFDISGYYEHNRCKTITLLLKNDLNKTALQEFAKEFTKLTCRIRCNNELLYGDDEVDLCKKFQDSVDGKVTLTNEEKLFLANSVFFYGIVSQTKFDETSDYVASIDYELFNGYFGEVLFYVLREQCLEDEKIMIEPTVPKPYSKQPGLDYVEIRKSLQDDEYYFIIGEIKTTGNTIGDYPNDIITSLTKRPMHLLAYEVNAFKERVKNTSNEGLKHFIDRIPMCFLNKSPQKRFAGVINYGSNNRHRQSVFRDFYSGCNDHLDPNNDCRRVKLIGIKDIEKLKKRVLGCIWKNLSI